MYSFILTARSHVTIVLTVSGAIFLLVCLGLQLAHPDRYVAATRIEASVPPPERMPDGELTGDYVRTAEPGETPRIWRVEGLTGHSAAAAEERLTALLDSWEQRLSTFRPEAQRTVTLDDEQLRKRRERLQEGFRAQQEILRKLDALDAALLALEARLESARRERLQTADPVGQLLGSLHELKATLAKALPADHPSLVQLAEDISELEAASVSHAQALVAARQLALFRNQLDDLLERYPPGHEEVRRKIAEISAAEVQVRDLRQGSAVLFPLFGENDWLHRQERHWHAEVRALEAEKQRLSEDLLAFEALQSEVARMEEETLAAEQGRSVIPVFRTLSGPVVETVPGRPRMWLLWALAASFCTGFAAAMWWVTRTRRIWTASDIPHGPWQTSVFELPELPTPRRLGLSTTRAVVAVLPWAVALAFFA